MDWTNQNKFTKWLIIILLAVNILTVSIIWIQTSRDKKGNPHPWDGQKQPESVRLMQRELELTVDQVEQFDKMRKEHLEATKIYNEQKLEWKKQIADEILKIKPDTNLINSLSAKIGSMETQLEKLRFKHFEQFASICTPAQKEKLKPVLVELYGKKPPQEEQRENQKPKKNEQAAEKNRQRERRDDNPPPLQQDNRPNPPSQEERLNRLTEKLDLNNEQVQKVRSILNTYKMKMDVLKENSKPGEKEFENAKNKINKEEDQSIMLILDQRQKTEFERIIVNRGKK